MRSIQRQLSLGLIGVLLLVGLVLAQTSLWLFDLGLRAVVGVDGPERTQRIGKLGAAFLDGLRAHPQHLSVGWQRVVFLPLVGHRDLLLIESQTLDDDARVSLTIRGDHRA